ncbi:MAG: FAD-binding oxidoreductase [Synergistaceae bacterium]|jgi:sarcosine oxidase subunit beta|nr:FAD-binding oxidoreductase [Synergistaceae bacterium]
MSDKRTADAIIVGGGVHGAAAAYYLKKAGVKDVVLFEKEYLSSGGSGRSAAGLRQHFGTEVNCRLAKYNLECFPTLEEELGGEHKLEFAQWGYLWVAYSQESMTQLEKNVKLQQSLDIPSETLSPQEMKRRWSYLNVDGMIGAAFCGKDGHINPHALTMAYGRAAEKLGAKVLTYSPVDKLLASGNKITGVVAKGEEWSAPRVLLTAGPWSTPLAATIGLDLPVTAERHNLLVTEPIEPFNCPMTLCLDDGAYFKQVPNGSFFFGRDDQDEPKTMESGNSAKFLEGVTKSVLQRIPFLKGVRIVHQWSGPYDVTPDHQAIIDWTPVEGLWTNCGWSGHGLQFGPSGGRLAKEMFFGEKTFVDIHNFRLSRFAEGDLFPEPAFI